MAGKNALRKFGTIQHVEANAFNIWWKSNIALAFSMPFSSLLTYDVVLVLQQTRTVVRRIPLRVKFDSGNLITHHMQWMP